ncbi:MAG: hypothetical protein ACMUIU_10540 [bacterium]
MKKLIFLMVACLIISIPDLGVCQPWTYNLNARFGIKDLNKNDWKPVDSQIEYGITLDFRQKTWPVNIALDILHSTDDGVYDANNTVEGKTLEMDLGVRKIWALKTFRPFIGGGAALISAKYKASNKSSITKEDDDTSIGIWINGGLYWTIKRFNIGFDLRWSKADVTFSEFNVKADAGGLHYGLITGIHF